PQFAGGRAGLWPKPHGPQARQGAAEPRCAGRMTSRAVAPDLTLQRSHRSEATGSVRNPRPAARSDRSFAKAVSSINKREEIDCRARFAVDTTGAGFADAGRRAPRSRTKDTRHIAFPSP